MNIFIGNIPHRTTEDELRELVTSHAKVDSLRLIKDRYTGDSKGFAFVEIGDQAEAEKTIQTLDGHMLDGRALKVNEAKPREAHGGGNRGNTRRPNRY